MCTNKSAQAHVPWSVRSMSSWLLAVPAIVYWFTAKATAANSATTTTAAVVWGVTGPLLVASSLLCNGDPENPRWLQLDYKCITLHSVVYLLRHDSRNTHFDTYILVGFGAGYLVEDTLTGTIVTTKDAALLSAIGVLVLRAGCTHGVFFAAGVAAVAALGIAAVIVSRRFSVDSRSYRLLRWGWHASVATFLTVAALE